MVLGHEAAGVVVEVGEQVNNLKPGDCVCMEPGIPDPNSRAARLGIYNLDPAVHFSEAWSYAARLPNNLNKSTVYSGTLEALEPSEPRLPLVLGGCTTTGYKWREKFTRIVLFFLEDGVPV